MLAETLTRFLSSHIPGHRSKKYLLAVSGGMDSMIMLDLFKSLGLEIMVAHCNFNLRAAESDLDQALVEKTCASLSIPLHTKQFDTLKEKEKQKQGTQMVARKLRYEWFEELRDELGCHYLCTAHHQRDNAETLVQRIMQGAYPESLQGIKPVTNNLVRPLLYAAYTDLEHYALEHRIIYRVDASNLSRDYTRNKIRQLALPVLNDVFGNHAEADLEHMTHRYKAYFDYLQQCALQLLKNGTHGLEINIDTLKQTHGNTALLYEAIKGMGFNWAQCADICADLNRESGSVYENNNHSWKLFFAGRVLQLVPSIKIPEIELKPDENKIQEILLIPEKMINIKVINKNELQEFTSGFMFFDYRFFENRKLTIRSWILGDVFSPLGMKGNKKVNDFLKDIKLSPAEKHYQLVLCIDEKIAGLIGRRIDDAYKITEHTKRVLVIG